MKFLSILFFFYANLAYLTKASSFDKVAFATL